MRYTVHMFPVVRITVKDIEASSQEEAIQKAEASRDLYQEFAGTNGEYAEENSHYLVDEKNDPEYARSRFYPGDTIKRSDVVMAVQDCASCRSQVEKLI